MIFDREKIYCFIKCQYIRSGIVVFFVLISAGFAISQIQDGYPDEVEQDFNAFLADTHNSQSRANYVKSSLHLGLDGSGVIVGVGDAVYQGESHIDMKGRHEILDFGLSNNGGLSTHGNHTSSTVGGNGTRNPRFEGIAPQVFVYSYRTSVEDGIMRGLNHANPPHILSNSWNSSDPVYADFYEQKGQYNIHSREIDSLSIQHADKLFVFSAGNSGGSPEGYPDRYLTLNPSFGASKNVLVVGRLGNPQEISLAASFGPARDGRIKPGIVATQSIVAPVENHRYEEKQGSSMSTPLVSGVAALMTQHYQNLNNGERPSGELLKAILMNSADYVKQAGPSFAAGFGSVNARRAAEVVTQKQFMAGEVNAGQSQRFTIEVPQQVDGKPIAQMKVMLYWHDLPAEPYAETALINNLDLTVEKDATQYLPWVLDTTPANVDQPATRGVDDLNNVEQVAIDNPVSGSYDVLVSGKAVTGTQTFHVVYTYVLEELELTFPIGGEKFFSGQTRYVLWDSQFLYDGRALDVAEYSTDNGVTWQELEHLIELEGGDLKNFYADPNVSMAWHLPSLPLTQALVRIRQGGLESVSTSFTVSQRLSFQIGADDNEMAHFSWNSVLGADGYEVLRLVGQSEWAVFKSVSDTTLVVSKSEFLNREEWLTVRAVNSDQGLYSQRAEAKLYLPTNSAPIAENDVAFASAFESVTGVNFIVGLISVLGNDTDLDGDQLQVVAVDTSQLGNVIIMDNQNIRYIPNGNFTGRDTLTYRITDNRGGFSEGTVIIALAPIFEIEPWNLSLDLGTVSSGDSLSVMLDFGNVGGSDMILHSPISEALAILSSDSLVIAPTEKGQFHMVLAAPETPGDFTNVITILSNVPNFAQISVSLAGVVQGGLVGDFNQDGQVSFPDFLSFANHFGTESGDATFDALYDIDQNGTVGFSDFLQFANAFGQTTKAVLSISNE